MKEPKTPEQRAPEVSTDATHDRRLDEFHLDGTAAGGMLADVFGRDITGDQAECGACGAHGAVGAMMAYERGPRRVFRCPDCGSVLLVVVRRTGRYRVTFDRLRSLDLPDLESG
jgi:hypothetical protein